MSSERLTRVWLLLISALLGTGAGAHAQSPQREPIGPFAADVRIAIPRFSEDTAVASSIGVGSMNLPSRGLGLAGGAHLYPFRANRVTFGFGGEILISGGRNTLVPQQEGGVAGPAVVTRFTAISPQLSLNFGAQRGWSYLSGGIGLAGFTTEREDRPVTGAPGRVRALNYGGGARWFARRHVAFAFDLRFYSIGTQEAAPGRPPYPSQRLMVFSAGASFK
jgi:hypothetical protein